MHTQSLATLALAFLSVPAFANDPVGAFSADPAPSTALPEDGAASSFHDALAGGRTWLKFRYRLESVDQDTPSDSALASTLRTAFGYETASWNHLKAAFEFEDVARVIAGDYDSGVNGRTAYPKVLDPTGASVNQAYVTYDGLEGTLFKVGRQEIILDNARFVGNVGWRQNHQSYNAVVGVCTAVENMTAVLAFVDDVNRITGATLNTNSIIFNVGYDLEDVGRIVGYFYDLDVQDAATLSSSTVGLRFTGKHGMGDDLDLLYTVEFANQTDTADNPNDVDADYLFLQIGAMTHGITVQLGSETLGGSGDVGDAFQTPLATLHAHNGYADIFAPGTPDDGLVDTSLTVKGKVGPVKASLIYHQFDSDSGSIDYGDELDLVFGYPIDTHTKAGLKIADFSAGDSASPFQDTTKVMLWLDYAVL
ncbi:MAG TPA: hypothetical protein ENJ09_07060 [Planctomycetes bacterium]|nr:hypothetical protein [Planctomycetota bacterium]